MRKSTTLDENKEDSIGLLLGIRRMIREKLLYLYCDDKDCDLYYIHCYDAEDITIGSTFVFYNKTKYPDRILVQGISKGIVASLFPESFVKLNSIVDTAVIDLCKILGVDKIEIHPIGDQGRILEKHYGYEKIVLNRELRDSDKFCDCESQTMNNIIYIKRI